MKFEDINLLIVSALYIKAMALFKTQAEQTAVRSAEQSSTVVGHRQASQPHGLLRLREKSQLTEEAFSDELTIFLSNGDYQGAWNSGQDSNYE